MSETTTAGQRVLICPVSATKGKAVKVETLRSLVNGECQGRITEGPYRYCDAQGCDVVYFSEDGRRVFTLADLKVRVGVKETTGPRPICYCFNHTVEEVYDEIRRTGKSTVPDDIKTRLNNEGCDCEHTNPQGSCCLGVVLSVVKEGTRRFAGTEATVEPHVDCCGPARQESTGESAQDASCIAVPDHPQEDCCAPATSPARALDLQMPNNGAVPVSTGKSCCE